MDISDIVGLIPKDWELNPLKDLGKISSGMTPLRSNSSYFDKEGIPWVKTTDLNNNLIEDTEEKISEYALQQTSIKEAEENSILIAMYGGFKQIGRTGLIKKKMTTNQAISSVRIDESEYHSKYVLHWLNQYRFIWKKFAISSRKDPNITKKDVEAFPIAKPKYKEQVKIADILSTWDKSIELKEQLIEQKKEQKKGLMQKLLTGEVRLPGFDGEWEEVKLKDIVKKEKGKSLTYSEDGDIPCIDMEFFETGNFKNYTHEAKVIAKETDILILWDGSRAGRTFAGVKGAVGSTFVKFNCLEVNNWFLQKHMEMNEGKIQRLREGSGIPHVPKDFLNYYKVKLPGLDEQNAISFVLKNIEKNIKLLLKEVNEMKEQKKGLMQLLLTGKVRVKV